MKTVDHSYEQALIMHDNVHIHVIMNIIMTPSVRCLKGDNCIKKTKKTWIGQKQQISVVLLQYIWDFGRGGGGQLLRVGLGLGGYFGTKRTRAGVLCEVIIRLLIPST